MNHWSYHAVRALFAIPGRLLAAARELVARRLRKPFALTLDCDADYNDGVVETLIPSIPPPKLYRKRGCCYVVATELIGKLYRKCGKRYVPCT